jgi:hypothetical protein
MSDDNPTLADLMLREWTRGPYRRSIDPTQYVARMIAQARKFVLDDRMSSFMADLAYASLPVHRDIKRDRAILEGMRILSRLPHKVTWIEYNLRERMKRSVGVYGPINSNKLVPEKAPEKGGWLLIQHEKLESAFMAIECISHSTGGRERAEGMWGDLSPIPNACPLAYAWTTDDTRPPWKLLGEDAGTWHKAAWMLTGIPNYDSYNVGWMRAPWLTDPGAQKSILQHHVVEDVQHELASDLRYLWALLSAINDTPTEYKVVRPQKGHMVNRNYKRFVEHTVITLKIPGGKDMTKVAQRITRASRRRAHDVRGFWRKDWRFPLAALCQHEFEDVPDTHLARCKLCQGRKIWIAEHQRGDASLGFVLHDYSVEHSSP